jgi:hypothetical protein
LLLDRTPLIDGAVDRLTVQYVPAWVYGTAVKYPAWLLSRNRVTEILAQGYELLAEFGALDSPVRFQDGVVANYVGQLWQLKK